MNAQDNITNSNIEDINFNLIYLFLLRNKHLISIISLTGVIIGIIFSITTKKTWQGEFQIVLDQNSGENSLNISNRLSRITGLSSTQNKIKTEVEILKSPSVLIDIFKFVKAEKIKKNKKNETLRFNDWLKNMDIDLLRTTSILKLEYQDKDKELIIPVLERISASYQDYSGSKRERRIELARNYFNEQLNYYSNKSDLSQKKVDEYSVKHNIYKYGQSNFYKYRQSKTNSESFNTKKVESQNSIDENNFITDVEQKTMEAKNELEFLNVILQRIKNLDSQTEVYLLITQEVDLPQFRRNIENINNLKDEITVLRSTLKDNDYQIINLRDELDLLVSEFNKTVISNLKQSLQTTQLKIESNKRPNDVIRNFKKLLSQAFIDQKSLNILQTNNISFSLEQARDEDPWKLITTPTLLPFPVAPNKKRLVFAFGLVSFSLAIAIAQLSEKKSQKIFTKEDFKTFKNIPYIAELSLEDKNSLDEFFFLFNQKTLSNLKGNLAILFIDKDLEDIDELILDYFKKNVKGIKIIRTSNLADSSKYENLIMVSIYGITKKPELEEFNSNIKLITNNFLGMISFNNKDSRDFKISIPNFISN